MEHKSCSFLHCTVVLLSSVWFHRHAQHVWKVVSGFPKLTLTMNLNGSSSPCSAFKHAFESERVSSSTVDGVYA